MSSEANKIAYRRFYEDILNRGDFSIVDELVAREVVSHNPLPDQKPGVEGFVAAIKLFRAAFPDLHARNTHLIAEGDHVVGRFVVTATHRGEFLGTVATGRRISYEEIVIVRFRDARIVEHWAVADALSIMQQIGAIPG
jgi:predicted ester cyclase